MAGYVLSHSPGTTHGALEESQIFPLKDRGHIKNSAVSAGSCTQLMSNDPFSHRESMCHAPSSGVTSSQTVCLHGYQRKKPDTYDGQSSWRDYRTHFELVAEINKWSEPMEAMDLATSLRGQAQAILTDLSPHQRHNFESLSSALEAHFEPSNQAEMYRAQLKNRLRRRDEGLSELGQSIKKLTRKAYPTATFELWGRLACDAFVDALNDADLEWAIYQGKPQSIEEAVRLGIECEAFKDGRKRRNYNRTGVCTQRMGCEQTSQSDVARVTAGHRDCVVDNNNSQY